MPEDATADEPEADGNPDGDADPEEEGKEKLPPMNDKPTRWILEPKETKKLYVKFFSTKVGSFN